jgi:hypothetical protein
MEEEASHVLILLPWFISLTISIIADESFMELLPIAHISLGDHRQPSYMFTPSLKYAASFCFTSRTA